jgi:hypothetical protein
MAQGVQIKTVKVAMDGEGFKFEIV